MIDDVSHYERTLELLDDAVHDEFGERLESIWADRTFNASYERPLLLLAALRYDTLCEGAEPAPAARIGVLPEGAGW